MLKFISITGALALVAACGGSGSDMTPRVPTQADLRAAEDAVAGDLLRIADFSPTSARNIPTSGRSVYNGSSALALSQGNREVELIGDSSLQIDFATGRTSGQADDFVGRVDGRAVRADGRIRYSGGEIGRGDEAGLFITDVDGTLDTGRDRIAIDGAAVGAFAGNRVEGRDRTRGIVGFGLTEGAQDVTDVPGLDDIPATMNAKLNGRPAVGGLIFTGEN
ncbi:hypothetical protein SAMN04488003_10551 [Loktanella fryxellensis]|uniref:Transferrin-binding protein B C-lobe/N-lobe beta barrel domain-containing protein n=1 Tax=Loktanella fryxellensis TaxID=245187 RepID=A0A1H8BHV0_9RHOB|nr:hypothetical protein [Loktanella fryxellensis]SEM82336.1 hypothetical protein SAMN04488003_10551 [Loktanella fryxellensis]